MNKEHRIERIVERAKSIVPKGYATLDEMKALSVPNGSLFVDPRYKFDPRLLSSEDRIVGSIRSVGWVGEIKGHQIDEYGNQNEGTRFWVAVVVEIIANGIVEIAIPFPATGMKDDEYDEMIWLFSLDRLNQCSERQLGLIADAVGARYS